MVMMSAASQGSGGRPESGRPGFGRAGSAGAGARSVDIGPSGWLADEGGWADAVQQVGADLAVHEGCIVDDPAVEREVGLDPADLAFGEGAPGACQGFGPILAPHHQLG